MTRHGNYFVSTSRVERAEAEVVLAHDFERYKREHPEAGLPDWDESMVLFETGVLSDPDGPFIEWGWIAEGSG